MSKKITLIGIGVCVISMALCVIAPCSYATMYNFDAPITDLYHDYAYYWGLSQTIGSNEKIAKASIQFYGINNWIIEPGDTIYMHLFQDAAYGKQWKYFNEYGASGDYFNGKGTHLVDYSDANETQVPVTILEWVWFGKPIWSWKQVPKVVMRWTNPKEDYTYNFTQDQIDKLSSAMVDGKFALGFDPDCYYRYSGLRFQIETNVVPEPATMSLLGFGLAGLLRFRKKKRSI